MTYLFLGDDQAAKDKWVAKIKKETLLRKDSLDFDFDILYAHKLDSDDLKKSLLALPTLSKKRLVLIKDIDKFSPHNKKIILEFLEKKEDHLALILDSNDLRAKDSFVKSLKPYVEIIDYSQDQKQNVFDMTRAISRRNSKEALKILNELLTSGDHPLQIMGALVWFWGKLKDGFPTEKFKEGLQVLQEADLNIKRSRLKADHALEVVVVKLTNLI